MPRQLRVDHFVQEEESGCLAACAQIALQQIGVTRSLKTLNRQPGRCYLGSGGRSGDARGY